MTDAEPRSSRRARLGRMFRALGHRNYRLFFFGQGVSLMGTWTQRLALSWLVYRITGSKELLGVVGFSSQILTFLFAPLAGVLADRAVRQNLLVTLEALAMTQAFVLAGLTLGGVIGPAHVTQSVWAIVSLSLVTGLVNAFEIPIRQSFVVEMLDTRDDLHNAIAMNSFLVNASRLAGPTLAGFLIAVVGEGWCFMLNGVSFLAVIAALLAMKVKPREISPHKARVVEHLKEGFRYAFGFAPIRAILILLTAVSLLGMPYSVLMPVFAKDVLGGGPGTLGFLVAATGAGALAGGVLLAFRRNVLGLGRVMALASATFGAALICFSLSRNFWLSMAILACAGFGVMMQMAASNTLLQTIVEDDKRGRVMSFYTMCFVGMVPFGSLVMGALAQRLDVPVARLLKELGLDAARYFGKGPLGAHAVLIVGGIGCILAAAVFASRLRLMDRVIQPLYIQRGIVQRGIVQTGIVQTGVVQTGVVPDMHPHAAEGIVIASPPQEEVRM